ncbi:MAG: hypothetical protein GY953_34065, partial [bacterium]|nr:hypothetical protein [bacterium]
STPVPDYLDIPGLILGVRAQSDATISVQTANGDFAFRISDVPAGRRKHFFSGGVSVERAATAKTVSQRDFESGTPAIAAEEGGSYWVAWVGYQNMANRVFVRRFDGTKWGNAKELTTGPSDVYLVRLASDGKGGLWAVWSNQAEDNFDLWGRQFNGSRWQPAVRLTSAPRPATH